MSNFRDLIARRHFFCRLSRRIASREPFGALCRRGDRRARSRRHDRRLSRLRFGCAPPDTPSARLGLRLYDGSIFGGLDEQPTAWRPLCRQRRSRPRHDRHVRRQPRGGSRTVRRGAAPCARDQHAEDSHDRPRWDEDPRQRQPYTARSLRARVPARGTTRGQVADLPRRGGGRGRCPERLSDFPKSWRLREKAFRQAAERAEDQSTTNSDPSASSRREPRPPRARPNHHDRQEAWRQTACAGEGPPNDQIPLTTNRASCRGGRGFSRPATLKLSSPRSLLVVAADLSTDNDEQRLEPMLDRSRLCRTLGAVETLLADAGCFGAAN